jgi:prepilin-type N-terminal cleavage/methylation domain-containing protein
MLDEVMPASSPTGTVRSKAGIGGYSLIELLVALALVAAILLLATGFAWQRRRIERRLTADRRAQSELENAYEEILGGLLPVAGGVLPVPEAAHGLKLTAEVVASDRPHLAHLTLTAAYRAEGEPFRRSLDALIFVP